MSAPAFLMAVFGPEDASVSALRRILDELKRAGATVSSLRAEVPWAALTLPLPADLERKATPDIMRWPDLLLRSIGQLASIGCRLEGPFSPAQTGAPHTPHPTVLREARSRVVPGQVSLAASAAPWFGSDERRLRPTLQPPGFRLLPPERAPAWRPAEASSVSTKRALAFGSAAWWSEVETRLELLRVARQPPGRLESAPPTRGDLLRIVYRVPETAWTYLVTDRPGGWALPSGDEPIRTPDTSARGFREVVLDERPGLERPLLIVSERPIHTLEAILAEADALSAAIHTASPSENGSGETSYRIDASGDARIERRLITLAQLLIEHAVPGFLLNEVGTAEHVAPPIAHLPASLLAARAAVARDDYRTAEPLLNEAVAQAEDPWLRAQIRLERGIALRRLHRSEDALRLLEAVEQEAMHVGDVSTAAAAARETGRALDERGAPLAAWPHLERAVALFQRANDRLGEARTHLYRAAILWQENQFLEARETYRRVVEPARQAQDLRLMAGGLEGLGQVCHDLGKLLEAEDAFRRALATYRTAGDRRGEMRVEGDLGLLALDRGEGLEAVLHFQRQVSLIEEVGPQHLIGIPRLSLGRAQLTLGTPAEARASLETALSCLPSSPPYNRILALCALCELALAQGELEAARHHLEQAGPVSAEEHPEASWRLALCWGRVREACGDPAAEAEFLRGVEAVERSRSSLPPWLRTGFLEISTSLFEGWIEHLVKREAEPARILDAIERSRARAFLDALQLGAESNPSPAGFAETRAPGPPMVPTALLPTRDILSVLPDDVVFLVLYPMRLELLAFRVDRNGIALRRLPCDRPWIQRVCQSVHQHCCDLEQPEPGALELLSERLLTPLADWIDASASKALGIVPHGPLHGVPLHALPFTRTPEETPQSVLIEHNAVYYVPSLQSVARILTRSPCDSNGLLVMADPEGDLPYARSEAQTVLQLLGPGRLVCGPEARREVLAIEGPGARVLHLALHGSQRRDGRGATLFLARTPGESSPGRDAPAGNAVTASDVARLTLDAELVTLSACESGRGALSGAGEGPDLLSWAFMAAGARAVISSGWRVPDRDTADLMAGLYARLARGVPRAQALAEAQRERIAARARCDPGPGASAGVGAPPYYWAGFSLMGDWR